MPTTAGQTIPRRRATGLRDTLLLLARECDHQRVGRGPRRRRERYGDEPRGAELREFVREERATRRDDHGNPVRTIENRQGWQAESDRLADWFLGLHPAVQRRITVFVARCPDRGCLLGRVFRRGDPRGSVRYVWLGVTGSGRGTAGIVNWAWDGYRGSKEHMVVGCSHGTGNIEFGDLEGMFEALDFPPLRDRVDANWLRHFSEPVQRGYARRTLIPTDTQWKAWSAGA